MSERSRLLAGCGLALGALLTVLPLAALVLIGIVVTGGDSADRFAAVAVFVIATIITSLLWTVLLGARPWMLGVNMMLLWLLEPPRGTAIVRIHVSEQGGEVAQAVLAGAGFEYVELLAPVAGAARIDFPSVCLCAWDSQADGDGGAALARATKVIDGLGIAREPHPSAQNYGMAPPPGH